MLITRAFLGWMAVLGAAIAVDGVLRWTGAFAYDQAGLAIVEVGLGGITMTIAVASIKGLGLLAKIVRLLDRPPQE